MPGLTITSSQFMVTVKYNEYKEFTGISEIRVHKQNVSFALSDDSRFVEITLGKWLLLVSFEESQEYRKVDTVGGIQPISNADLMDKLEGLI